MTEPTAEQVAREAERAHAAINGGPGMCRGTFPDGTPWHSPLCMSVATALARVRKEAHTVGRDEALEAALGVAEEFDNDGRFSAWEAAIQICNAIRALRGRT